MEPREYPSAQKPPDQRDAEELSRTLHDLRNPLTLVNARAQMLTRQIKQGRIQEVHECQSALTVITHAVRLMEASLDKHENGHQNGRPGSTTDTGTHDVDGGPLL